MQYAYANALYSKLSPIWTKTARITVRWPLFNASWTDDQSLIRRPRRFRVKPSLTRDLIWTALVQQKLRLNRGQGQIWTWFKLDRRWWNAPSVFCFRDVRTSEIKLQLTMLPVISCSEQNFVLFQASAYPWNWNKTKLSKVGRNSRSHYRRQFLFYLRFITLFHLRLIAYSSNWEYNHAPNTTCR